MPVTRGKGLIVAGAVTVVVGLVLGAASLVLLLGGAVGALGDQLGAQVFAGPGSQSIVLDPGRYLVFAREVGFGPQAGPGSIFVTGPDGLPVQVTGAFFSSAGAPNGWPPNVIQALVVSGTP